MPRHPWIVALVVSATLFACQGGRPAPVCGNGRLEGSEQCDDGNTVGGDGCEANCTPTVILPGCGDGEVQPPEECDDGNDVNADGCETDCTLPRCGNGIPEDAEDCDDGNQTPGDGCENDCTYTPGPRCGNGVTEGTEQCDDGNRVDGDACESDCTLPRCGNAIKDGVEQCDDGNQVSSDGCENDCTLTPAPGCGNGAVEAGEQCDDGNLDGGDGCEANCAFSTTGTVLGCPGMNVRPPDAGICAIVTGDGSKVITGVILGAGQVLVGGQVRVAANGTIACVGCDCTSDGGAAATQLVCPRGVVSPGLINSHDHISFQANPYVGTTERYEHRNDWRRANDGHTAINNGGNATNGQIRWAELRQVMAGTTSIVGATYSTTGNQGFLRNLDGSGQEGLGAGTVNSDTFPLGDTGGLELTTGCAYPSMPSAGDVPATSSYLPHIGEGIEQSALNEFACISTQAPAVIGARTGVVHGIGFKAPDVQYLAQASSSLVWSPRSNVSLYGDTAAVPLYRALGVNIALGTDWTISGSMNLLRELRCADFLNATRFNHALSDEELWRTVTSGAADATSTTDKLGRLVAGKVADVAIYRRRPGTPWRSVIEAAPGDVVMTMRGGKVLYGDESLVNAFDTTAQCEAIDVCGVAKRACVRAELTTALTGAEPGTTLASLQRLNSSTYPLFSCTTPTNEPSCVPERAAGNSRNGSTIYTAPPGSSDQDGDGIADSVDNCPAVFNPVRPMDGQQQADADRDAVGDVCDPCPLNPNTTSCTPPDPNDRDGDGVANALDNCPLDPNTNQLDADGDNKGDVCDPCPTEPNPGATACPASIYAIKAPGSPLVGQRVSLGNVLVTAVGSAGFFVQVHPQDPGYAGPDYSGLYAYRPASGLDAGDRVNLADVTPTSYYGQIQITAPVLSADGGMTRVSSGNPLPAPVLSSPQDLAQNDGGMAVKLESVLVRVENVSVISVTPDAGAGDRAPTNEFVVTGGLRVNDLLYLTSPFPTVGQGYSSITGVLELRNGNYKVEPRFAQDLATGPAVVAALEPAVAYVREGQDGGIPTPIVVRLSSSEASDVAVEVTASTGDLIVADGGLIIVPANQTTAEVPIVGVTANDAGVVLTASRAGSSQTSLVYVLGAADLARLASLTPATAGVSPGGRVTLTAALDLPAPGPTDVTLSLAADAGFGTLPATVTIPQDHLRAQFDFVADATASGSGTVTATLGADSASAVVTAQIAGTDHVVISEVAVKGTTAGDEFVELYNPGPQAADISGWRIQYLAASGSGGWQAKATVPANTSIPSRGYYLIASPSYSTGAVAADLRAGADLGFSGNSGHVRVTDEQSVEVDKLAYGAPGQTVPTSPETSPFIGVAVSGATESYERKALPTSDRTSMGPGGADATRGNGTDTDDNSQDFVLRATRDPQSLQSGVLEP